MEKLINIDGRDVKFATNAATPIRYKQHFQSDFFADLAKLAKLADSKNNKLENLDYSDLELVNFDVIYQIIWIMAKTGNKEIPNMAEWLETFDRFPLDEVLTEAIELIEGLMKRKK